MPLLIDFIPEPTLYHSFLAESYFIASGETGILPTTSPASSRSTSVLTSEGIALQGVAIALAGLSNEPLSDIGWAITRL